MLRTKPETACCLELVAIALADCVSRMCPRWHTHDLRTSGSPCGVRLYELWLLTQPLQRAVKGREHFTLGDVPRIPCVSIGVARCGVRE
jgi:hypothetical protein